MEACIWVVLFFLSIIWLKSVNKIHLMFLNDDMKPHEAVKPQIIDC